MQDDIERGRVGDAVRRVLRRTLSCFSDEDVLAVWEGRANVRIAYSPLQASGGPGERTTMRLSLRRDTDDLWISSLHVAVPFRSMGLGRQLVQAAEAIARAAGVTLVSVFPLYSSHAFWLKMGYRPMGCTSRVLSRQVPPGATVWELAAARARGRSRLREPVGRDGRPPHRAR